MGYDGSIAARYTYDVWGNIVSVTDANGNAITDSTNVALLNPFRYRGYMYDNETGFYYLRSRYYDPEVGRFLNADSTGLVTANPTSAKYDKNLFAYCDNNPVSRRDTGGDVWETVFDVITICVSVVDVVANPSDVGAWIGLACDVVDLIPFVTGVGEVARGIRTANKIVDTGDALHDLGKASDTVKDLIQSTAKVNVSKAEIDELLLNGKVRGYQGHHMKSVKGYPSLAGDPTNIQFLTRQEHLLAHRGNFRNITHGRYIP